MSTTIRPGAFGIEYNPDGQVQCGHCGLTWEEDITPAGRCPWEWDHEYDEDEH